MQHSPDPMLKETLARDLKDAMRARDTVRLAVVRSIQTAITMREKESGTALSDDDLVAVVQKQAKQRRDSLQQFSDAGRDDLAQREADELAWIEQYLPAQLSDDEVRSRVASVIQTVGASSMKDMGQVMGAAMAEMKGLAEGRRVQAAVRELLGS